MKSTELDVLQGTLDMFILKAVSFTPRHGYNVLEWLRQTTRGELRIEDATMYPALHRLEARGFIDAEWGLSENNRRAKYYKLTAAGRRQLTESTATWNAFAETMARIMAAPAPGAG
jgi:PadR family transcriptional regulator, regulatory protein PadR